MEKQQSSNEYGMSSELFVLSELVNYGIVSIPYGNSARYDCILDIQGDLYKIQIKSVNQISDDIILVPFSNTRMSANGPVKKAYTSTDVDFMCIGYHNQVYLFPTSMAKRELTVRITKDNLTANSHYLEDYRIEKVLDIDLKTWVSLKEETRKTNGFNLRNPQYTCPCCGTPVSTKGAMCINCARLESRKVERPNREELKKLIRTTPFTRIAEKYGLTDNSIRKWCKGYNLPYRVQDIKKYTDKEWEEV